MDSEKKIYQIPEFTGENIPLKEATRIMDKAVLGVHGVCVSWENSSIEREFKESSILDLVVERSQVKQKKSS